MAVNKPVGDNARKGAVKKRTQRKATFGGVTTWTWRSEERPSLGDPDQSPLEVRAIGWAILLSRVAASW